MQILKKNKILILLLLGVAIVYFISRTVTLLNVPIFTDEAIYTRWSQIAKQDPNWRFISLTDGKQPLFVWVDIIFLKLFSDPLVAGRMVSVFAGFATLLGMFVLGWELFKNKWIGFVSSVLYLLYPMVVVYDRLSLYDSMVGTFFIWSLYLSVLLVRRIRLDIAFIFSMVTGAGLLTKSSNLMNLALLPFSLLLFDWKVKGRRERVVKWAVFAGIGAVIAYGYYNILRLSPFFHIIAEKNTTFIYPVGEWIHHPFTYFVGNLTGLSDWLSTYLTLPILLLVILSFFFKSQYREKILLAIAFLMPFIYAALFGKVLYPRYLLFMSLPLLFLAAYSVVQLTKILSVKKGISIFMLLLLPALYTDGMILTNFAHAPIPLSDRNQLYNGWPAGNGVRESVQFFNEQAKTHKIYIATQGTFGLLPYALEIYLKNNPNIIIEAYWPIQSELPDKLDKMRKTLDTYLVFYQDCPPCESSGKPPVSWPTELIKEYQQGTSEYYFRIYRLNQ
jgi:4-amino-4-deoxy-L-arabinose transferase-like glycosyltransferase